MFKNSILALWLVLTAAGTAVAAPVHWKVTFNDAAHENHGVTVVGTFSFDPALSTSLIGYGCCGFWAFGAPADLSVTVTGSTNLSSANGVFTTGWDWLYLGSNSSATPEDAWTAADVTFAFGAGGGGGGPSIDGGVGQMQVGGGSGGSGEHVSFVSVVNLDAPTTPSAVPEPGTLLLSAAALLAGLARGRQRATVARGLAFESAA